MSVSAAVRDILIEDLGLAPELVDRGHLFSDGGLDSLDQIRFLELLRERFSVEITWAHLSLDNVSTVSDVARLVSSMSAGSPLNDVNFSPSSPGDT
jgi:acyl carrier protein